MPEQKEPRSVRRMLMSWKKKISLLRKGSSSKALSPASDTSSPVGDTASEETAVADKSDKLTAMRKARSEGTAHRDIGAAPAHATINSSQSFASASMSTIRSGIGAYERKKVAATGFEGGGLKKLYHNKSTPSLVGHQHYMTRNSLLMHPIPQVNRTLATTAAATPTTNINLYVANSSSSLEPTTTTDATRCQKKDSSRHSSNVDHQKRVSLLQPSSYYRQALISTPKGLVDRADKGSDHAKSGDRSKDNSNSSSKGSNASDCDVSDGRSSSSNGPTTDTLPHGLAAGPDTISSDSATSRDGPSSPLAATHSRPIISTTTTINSSSSSSISTVTTSNNKGKSKSRRHRSKSLHSGLAPPKTMPLSSDSSELSSTTPTSSLSPRYTRKRHSHIALQQQQRQQQQLLQQHGDRRKSQLMPQMPLYHPVPPNTNIPGNSSYAHQDPSTRLSQMWAYQPPHDQLAAYPLSQPHRNYYHPNPMQQQQQQQHKSQTMRATTYRQSVLMSQIFTSDQHQQQARAKLHTPQRQSSQPSQQQQQQQQQQQHRHQLNSATSSRRRSSTHTTSIYGLGAAAKSESSLAYQKRLSRLNSGMLVPQSGVQLGSAPYLPNYYQAQYSMQGLYQMPPFV